MFSSEGFGDGLESLWAPLSFADLKTVLKAEVRRLLSRTETALATVGLSSAETGRPAIETTPRRICYFIAAGSVRRPAAYTLVRRSMRSCALEML
jgi:hypothetical protein